MVAGRIRCDYVRSGGVLGPRRLDPNYLLRKFEAIRLSLSLS